MNVIPTRQLDGVSLEYLARADQAGGQGSEGVFVRLPGRTPSPRLGQILGLCLGLGLVALGVGASRFLDFEQASTQTMGHLQAIVLALGIVLVVGRLLALRRPVYRSPVGHFLWADAQNLWQVTPEAVSVVPLAEIRSASVTHMVNHHVYSHSEAFLRLKYGSETLTIPSRERAEELVRFLGSHRPAPEEIRPPIAGLPQPAEVPPADEIGQAGGRGRWLGWGLALVVLVLGISFLPGVNERIREDRLYAATLAAGPGEEAPFQRYLEVFPEGRYADEVKTAFEENLVRLALGSPEGELGRYERYLLVFPEGSQSEQVRSAYQAHLLRAVRQAPPGEVAAHRRYLALFPNSPQAGEVQDAIEDSLARHADASHSGEEGRYWKYLELYPQGRHAGRLRTALEDNLHRYARGASPEDDRSCGRYLELFPQGRHATEMKRLRDDRRFAQANRQASDQKSPAPLRRYLSDPANVAHRSKAQSQIDEIYDHAIKDLKRRRVAAETDDDRRFDETVGELLEALKRVERPVVTVAFKGSHTDGPSNIWALGREKASYQAYLRDHPELKELEARQGTALLARGALFDPALSRRREEVCFSRLQAGLGRVFATDLITLERASAAPSPTIEIGYHLSPVGDLLAYERIIQERAPGRAAEKKGGAIGLLRLYDLRADLKVRLPGSDRILECRLTVRGGKTAITQSTPGDPEWSPYAIQLHLSFLEMADRMHRAFGGTPDPPKESWTFREVTGG